MKGAMFPGRVLPLASALAGLLTAGLGAQVVAPVESDGIPMMGRDRTELALPLFDRKMVIAHNMTEEVSRYQTGIDVDLYRPEGSTAALGGIHQFLPMDPVVFKGRVRTLDEVAASEIRSARMLGLDGFQFYFPHSLNAAFMYRYSSNVIAHVKAAARVHPAFRVTLCFAPLDKAPATTRITNYQRYLRFMLEETRGLDTWLKTPDGRHLFFTWIGDNIIPDLGGRHWQIEGRSDLLGKVAGAFDQIVTGAGVRGAFIHQLRFPNRPDYLSNFYDYFPGGWNWTDPKEKIPSYQAVARFARERGRLFSFTTYNDFYTSKVFKKGTWDMYHDAGKAVAAGLETLGRHGMNGGLSATYRAWLEAGLAHDGPLLNVATWNDFREGHHLAPEVNHNFVPGILLDYYRRKWTGMEPAVDRETIMVFYKKYAHAVKPGLFPIAVSDDKTPDTSLEDDLEILTLLQSPGEVFYNGKSLGQAPAGLTSFRVKPAMGRVVAEVRRGSGVVCTVAPPEWITDKPYRTDRLTYMYSSRCPELFHAVYGPGATMPVSDEYAEKVPGVPNWTTRAKAERKP